MAVSRGLTNGRRGRRVCLALAAASLLAGTAGAAVPGESNGKAKAEDAKAKSEKFGDWGLLCPETKEPAASAKATEEEKAAAAGDPIGCRLLQSAILNAEAKQGSEAKSHRVMLTGVGFVPDETQPMLTLLVPLGILLPPGVVVEIEGIEKQQLRVQRCDASGCLAYTSLSEPMIAALRKGKEAHVTFFNLTRKASRVRISLDGFGAGLDAMQAKRKAAQ